MSEEKPLWSFVDSCPDEGFDPKDTNTIYCFKSKDEDYLYELRDQNGFIHCKTNDEKGLEWRAEFALKQLAKEKGWIK